MTFINIEKVRGLKVGMIVFTKNDKGEFGVGKLTSRTEDLEGMKCVFEVPQYFEKDKPVKEAVKVTNIVSVCIIKEKDELL